MRSIAKKLTRKGSPPPLMLEWISQMEKQTPFQPPKDPRKMELLKADLFKWKRLVNTLPMTLGPLVKGVDETTSGY
jgi:hypothetical protein